MSDGQEEGEESDSHDSVGSPESAVEDGRLYRRVVYVRVTETEWEAIRQRA